MSEGDSLRAPQDGQCSFLPVQPSMQLVGTVCGGGRVVGEAPGVADTVSAYHLLEEGEEIKFICQVSARYQACPSFPSVFTAMDQGGH